MAKDIALDRVVYADGVDLTGVANKVDWPEEVAVLPCNTYADGDYEVSQAGIRKSTVAYEGYLTDTMLVQRALLGNNGVTITSAASPGTAGASAFMVSGLAAKWAPDSQIGNMQKVTGMFEGQGPLGTTSGKLVLTGTVVSAGASSAGQQLAGGIVSGGHLVTTLHCLAVTGGPTVTAIIESASASNFPSPTTVATFVDVTAVGAQKLAVAGPITDTWFRITYTIDTGTATLACAVGASAT